MLSIILIALCALALMALEAFIPGVSLAGLVGIVLIVIGAYLSWEAYGLLATVMFLIICSVLSFFIFRLIYRSMKSGQLSRSGIFLNETVSPAIQTVEGGKTLACGAVGTAKTTLHPSGIAEFDGERMHVSVRSGFVEQGAKVRVVQIEGSRVAVAPVCEKE